MDVRWTNHALDRLEQWSTSHGVDRREVEQILEDPDQVVPGDRGAKVAQERYGGGLLRIVFVEASDGRRVLTVYWTSQVDRYWSGD